MLAWRGCIGISMYCFLSVLLFWRCFVGGGGEDEEGGRGVCELFFVTLGEGMHLMHACGERDRKDI